MPAECVNRSSGCSRLALRSAGYPPAQTVKGNQYDNEESFDNRTTKARSPQRPRLAPIRITQDTEKPPLRYALRATQDAVFRKRIFTIRLNSYPE